MSKFAATLSPHKRFPAYGIFLVLGALATFIGLMASPSDPKNAVFLGYSMERILLGGAVLVAGIALLALTLSLLRSPEHSQRLWEIIFQRRETSNKTLIIFVVVFLLLWILLFLPSYRLGVIASYLARLFPILVWLIVTSSATILVLLFERRKGMVKGSFMGNWTSLKTSLIVFSILLLIAFIMMFTGLGIHDPADYWYGAGVPILGLQIIFSLLAGVLFHLLEPKLAVFKQPRLDLFLFMVIWIVAAWFWGREPLSPNYFMPDTANNIVYPYSDSATFDAGAQTALIGQGLFNGVYFERVLYSIFLVYLHMLFGQNYETLMMVQAALFAIFPAVIYLIGRELHSRSFGISAGVLIAARGLNAIIAAKWIDTASPKMALTDFPTAIGLSIFLLLLLQWHKEPARIGKLVWAGAVLGFMLMVRSQALTLLPVVLVFIPFFLKLRWKQIVLTSLLVLMGVLSATLPWELRNQSRGIPMYSMYYSRIVTILRARYGISADPYIPVQATSQMTIQENAFFHREPSRQKFLNANESLCSSALCSIAHHFLHNAVTSFISLPTSLVFDDLWNIVKADTPYWKQNWSNGRVTPLGGALIFLNLVVISLGVGMMWSRTKVLALLPLIFFTVYLFTNSIGLTSGGRYVAPVDWIVSLYFIAGGLQLVLWFLKAADISIAEKVGEEKDQSLPVGKDVFAKTLPTVAFILMIGALLPLSEVFQQPRYQVRESGEILASLDEAGFLDQSPFSKDDLVAFLAQPNAMIREGRALYPRYYLAGDGEQDRSTYFRYLDYQRLVFTLIGPYSYIAEGVVIPGYAPPLSFHAEDVVVLGCWNTTYYAPFIDAILVISTSGEGYVYNRVPEAPLQCPLPEPKQ